MGSAQSDALLQAEAIQPAPDTDLSGTVAGLGDGRGKVGGAGERAARGAFETRCAQPLAHRVVQSSCTLAV